MDPLRPGETPFSVRQTGSSNRPHRYHRALACVGTVLLAWIAGLYGLYSIRLGMAHYIPLVAEAVSDPGKLIEETEVFWRDRGSVGSDRGFEWREGQYLPLSSPAVRHVTWFGFKGHDHRGVPFFFWEPTASTSSQLRAMAAGVVARRAAQVLDAPESISAMWAVILCDTVLSISVFFLTVAALQASIRALSNRRRSGTVIVATVFAVGIPGFLPRFSLVGWALTFPFLRDYLLSPYWNTPILVLYLQDFTVTHLAWALCIAGSCWLGLLAITSSLRFAALRDRQAGILARRYLRFLVWTTIPLVGTWFAASILTARAITLRHLLPVVFPG